MDSEWGELVDRIQFEEYVPVIGKDLRIIHDSGKTVEQILVDELTTELDLVFSPPSDKFIRLSQMRHKSCWFTRLRR